MQVEQADARREVDPEAASESESDHQAARRAAGRRPGAGAGAQAGGGASRPSGRAAGSGGYGGVDDDAAAAAAGGADADAVQGGRVRGVPGRGPGPGGPAGDAAAVLPQVPLRVRPPVARHPPGLPLLPRARAVRRHARPPTLSCCCWRWPVVAAAAAAPPRGRRGCRHRADPHPRHGSLVDLLFSACFSRMCLFVVCVWYWY